MADSIKDFSIATTFILVASVGLLLFALTYPALNGETSILANNPQFNETANNLTIALGNFQSQQNLDINISTSDEPTVDAQSLQLVSTVSTSRNILGRMSESFKLITNLLGNVFGLSGGQFTLISGALISLFGLVLLYFVVRVIRWGQ